MELKSKEFCTSNKGCLVRFSRLVMHLAALHLRNNSVANREKCKELLYFLTLRSAARGTNASFSEIKKRVYRYSFEYRAHLRECPPWLLAILALAARFVNFVRISETGNGTTAELHLVACGSSRLV